VTAPRPRAVNTLAPIRIRELDALRGIAAMMVVLYHYTTRYDALYGHRGPLALRFPLGHHGVDLFFIISGFVILMTLDRARSTREFVVARFSRLFPAFWTACGLTLLVTTLFPLDDQPLAWTDAALNLTMIPRVLGAEYIDGVYWTLQTELIFYAVAGLTVAIGARKHLLLVLGALVLLDAIGVRVGGRFRFFLIGVVFYELMGRRLGWKDCVLLALCLAGIIRHEAWIGVAMITAMAAAVFAASRRRIPLLANPVLVYLGVVSYSLYLVHQNIGYVIIKLAYEVGLNPHAAVLAAIAVAIALASILTFGVERPANRALRRLLTPRRTPAPIVPGSVSLPPATAGPVVIPHRPGLATAAGISGSTPGSAG
jgi:peptidoglycan/LPS O-acetylase OafA/YrhL